MVVGTKVRAQTFAGKALEWEDYVLLLPDFAFAVNRYAWRHGMHTFEMGHLLVRIYAYWDILGRIKLAGLVQNRQSVPCKKGKKSNVQVMFHLRNVLAHQLSLSPNLSAILIMKYRML